MINISHACYFLTKFLISAWNTETKVGRKKINKYTSWGKKVEYQCYRSYINCTPLTLTRHAASEMVGGCSSEERK